MTSFIKRLNHKFLVLFYMLFSPVFVLTAQEGGGSTPAVLQPIEKRLKDILNLLSSPIVRIPLILALAGLVIGLIINKDSETAKKKFLIWLIAVLVLMSIGPIANFFIGTANVNVGAGS